jgi:hypothetical protein
MSLSRKFSANFHDVDRALMFSLHLILAATITLMSAMTTSTSTRMRIVDPLVN